MQKEFEEFIFSRQLEGLSEKSVECYTSFISPFLAYVGDVNLVNLNRKLIERYIYSILQKNLSRATVATYIRHLKVFLRWLEENCNVDLETQKIRIPKSPKKVLRIYSDLEIQEIFSAVYTDTEWIACRDKAVIALMLDSGLRQKEVCTLKKEDVQFQTRIIKVCGKGNKERIVPCGNRTVRYLMDYLEECPYTHGDYLFYGRWGEPLSCNAVKKFMYKMAQELSFEFGSHRLRHNFATNYCLDQYTKNGQVDIYRLMILMGHSDVETTRRYLHMANQLIAVQSNISHLDSVI